MSGVNAKTLLIISTVATGTIQNKTTENTGADSGDPENIYAQFLMLPSAKLKSSNVSICAHKFARKWYSDGSNLMR
jgi:hypothetical protein